MLGAIGIIYGDIGTSPLYAVKETFAGHHPLAVVETNVLGVLSLIFWTIMLLVSVKYVLVMMRADNRGEGGSLSLLALVNRFSGERPRLKWAVAVLGMLAAALFFGDSMITPAISVLSAVEGLDVVTDKFDHLVVPITLIILTLLFLVQRHGTGVVGAMFGPIMLIWFITIGLLGILAISNYPRVLFALDPQFAFKFLSTAPTTGFWAMGAVILAVTGGEALYTDMGHFGKQPIRLTWFGLVMPALVLNYLGQGALLLTTPAAIQNPFYLMAPSWALMPMVILATVATVIASQAVISGAFSVANQCVQMALLPRMPILQTSDKSRGQIYVPFTNWTLYIAVVFLVFTFQSSSNLAAAYGIAVTGTMTIDTLLISLLIILAWKWPPYLSIPLIVAFLVVDLSYLAANAVKIPHGGWFPLGIAVMSFVVLSTWKRGRSLVFAEVARLSVPIQSVLDSADDIHHVGGTAVFLHNAEQGTPSALFHNIKHNKVLHERNIILTVIVEDKPYVSKGNRLLVDDLGKNFYRVRTFYGFMEIPDIPAALEQCVNWGLKVDMMSTSFFVSKALIVAGARPRMVMWRERLFQTLARNAMNAADYFKIPSNRVVEMGTRIEI
jgi:KUP system potassium uptake protein